MTRLSRRHFIVAGAAAGMGGLVRGALLINQKGLPWAPRVARLGYLGSDSRPGYERFAALVEGLRALGYIEGQHLAIERRLSQDQTGAVFLQMAQDLLSIGEQVIVTSGTPALVAAARATGTVPIVAGGPNRNLEDL